MLRGSKEHGKEVKRGDKDLMEEFQGNSVERLFSFDGPLELTTPSVIKIHEEIVFLKN